jgi:hypothetical protein
MPRTVDRNASIPILAQGAGWRADAGLAPPNLVGEGTAQRVIIEKLSNSSGRDLRHDYSMKKAPRRALVAWLAFVWLVIPYPYGLLLFFLCAGGFCALQRLQEGVGVDPDAGRIADLMGKVAGRDIEASQGAVARLGD